MDTRSPAEKGAYPAEELTYIVVDNLLTAVRARQGDSPRG